MVDFFAAAKAYGAGLSFHRRVTIWDEVNPACAKDISVDDPLLDQALDIHNYAPGDKYSGSDRLKNFIKSHRLPLQLKFLAFDERYSLKGEFDPRRPDGIKLESWNCSIQIDKDEHILEATISQVGEVFHFYARPVRERSVFPFVSSLSDAATYPELGACRRDCPATNLDGLSFSKSNRTSLGGDITLQFDGREYKIIRIK